ncbi:MAG: ferritin-like domain-containing protein [Waddliaceae bacterium]
MASNQNHQQFYHMFIKGLQDIFSAEDQYIEAMPKFLNAISTDELREKLKAHFEETKRQKDRLQKIFSELNETPTGTFCKGMQALLDECNKIISENFPGIIQDAALISALQKCEHYEIATYGALRTFAKHLELSNVKKILQEILDEEWNADKNLTSIAEGGWFTAGINLKAAQ